MTYMYVSIFALKATHSGQFSLPAERGLEFVALATMFGAAYR